MHKRPSALFLPAARLALIGCAGFTKVSVGPPPAFVVCNVTAPLTVDCGGVPAGNLKLPPPIRTGISLYPIRLWI